MAGSILGTSGRRVEDLDLITGASTFVGNLDLDGVLQLAFVRSPLAHAAITGIDTAAAQVGYYELGLTRDGAITGMRARVVADTGAYAGFGGGLAMGPTYMMCQGVYAIPKIGFDAAAAMTNTTPVGAFRGAGRPEATAYLERLMDVAADELGLDPVQIRRRNLIDPAAFPFDTLSGMRYDNGDYDLRLREALRLADYEELRAEQASRRAAGDPVQPGIGISVYVEITAGGGGSEYGSVTVHADGSATISAGTSAHGQGHATAFAMLVNERLGIPMDRIGFVQSDTARVPRGSGTGGSRSLQMGGSAVLAAADDVLEQARRRAADLMEVAVHDVELTADGEFGVAGETSTTMSWQAGGGRGGGAALRARHEPGRGDVPVRCARVGGGGRHPTADRHAGRLPDALGRGPVPVRHRQHRDPDAEEPVGRQGNRGVGNRASHPRGAERGGRCAAPVRDPAPRPAVHPATGLACAAGRPGRPQHAAVAGAAAVFADLPVRGGGAAAAEGGEI